MIHVSLILPQHWCLVGMFDPLRPPLPSKMGVSYAQRYANGHISATGDPIQFMFGSRVGFSGSADRMALFGYIKSKLATGRHLGMNECVRARWPIGLTLSDVLLLIDVCDKVPWYN